MTEETARKSIDWLESMGNKVLALMGGEPLLRPDFVHKITYYAAKKGFFVYLPTNGRLMRPDVIDRLGDAGLAAVNLAVDSIPVKPSLPKALWLHGGAQHEHPVTTWMTSSRYRPRAKHRHRLPHRDHFENHPHCALFYLR